MEKVKTNLGGGLQRAIERVLARPIVSIERTADEATNAHGSLKIHNVLLTSSFRCSEWKSFMEPLIWNTNGDNVKTAEVNGCWPASAPPDRKANPIYLLI